MQESPRRQDSEGFEAMNHHVTITELGDNRCKIEIDDYQIMGVTEYVIHRTLDPLQHVTFTIFADKVSVLPAPAPDTDA